MTEATGQGEQGPAALGLVLEGGRDSPESWFGS